MFFGGHQFSAPLGEYKGVHLLDIKRMFRFVRNCQAVLQSGCTLLHPYHGAPVASHGYQLCFHQGLHFGHSNRRVVISPCFNLQFSSDL